MRLTLFALIVVIGGFAGPVDAQPRPDFTGTWIQMQIPAFLKRFTTPDMQVWLIVRQSEVMLSSTLRIVSKTTGEMMRPEQPPGISYLDGKPRTRKQIDGSLEVTTTAWNGSKLVIRVTRSKTGQTTHVGTRTWWIDDKGMLVVEVVETPYRNGRPMEPAREVTTLRRK